MIPRLVFILLLGILALIAVPFGANRQWAWALVAVLVGVMLLAMALSVAVNPASAPVAWSRYRVLAGGFLLVLAWMLLQAAPWTPAALHHPLWAEAARTLGRPVAGAIALDPPAALSEAVKFATYGGIFWLAMQFSARDRRARLLLWVVLLAVFVNAAYGLVVQFTGAETILWFKRWAYATLLSGTFVNRNHFATYAGIGIVIGFGFLLEELRRIASGVSLRTIDGLIRMSEAVDLRLYSLLAILGVLGLAVILTGSRAALAVIACGLFCTMACAALSAQVTARRVVRLGLVLAAVGIVAVAISGQVVVERLEAASRNASDRMEVYKATARAIADRPILGVGGGSFENVFFAYRPAVLGATNEFYDHVHNTYLEFAIEHGVPALLIVLVMGAIVFARFFRGVASRHRNDLVPATGAGVTTVVALHAMLDFSLEIPAVAVTCLAVLGACYAQSFAHADRYGASPGPGSGGVETAAGLGE